MKHTTSLFILPIILMSFSRCSSQKKLQEKAPVELEQVYCQPWVAGVKGGGSGLNIFIPVKVMPRDNVVIDSVYFRGKVAKLETKPQNPTLYIGRFQTTRNKKKDIIMSGDGNAEYGNEIPKISKPIPFELKKNECVISYKTADKTEYFKIVNIVDKPLQALPFAPPPKKQ